APVLMILACIAAEAVVLRVGIDDLDEGYFVQQAARVLHGQVPYRDFETLYAPGLVYLHALTFAAVGGPSLLAMRALALTARAGLSLMLFALARPLVRHPLWASAPALILLLGLDDAPVRWEPHPGWLSTLFGVVGVWCASHGRTRGWLIAAGASAAAAYLFKQNTGVFVLAALLVWSGRKRLVIPLVAFVAVSLLWLAPLLFALRSGGDLADLGVLVGAVRQAGLVSPPEPAIVLPLACLLGGVWLVRQHPDPRPWWYLLAGSALFLTQYPRMDTLHLAWSAPLLLVVGSLILDRLRALPAVALVAVALALLWPTWSDRVAYVAQPRQPLDGVEAPIETAADLQGVIADIQRRTSPGEPIFVYPTSPLLYVLADRPNPTRFDHLNPGAASPAQIDQVIDDLAHSRVKLVVISDFWEQVWGSPGPNAVLEDWLASHYTDVARHGAYRVLAVDL
ncbi:MAG TPA: hypothetical protein VF937_17400, partial [Chloroflexota bacterium]